VPSAYCVASWSSSVGYPSVILSFLPSPLLLVVLLVRWKVLSVFIVSQRGTGLAACLGLAQNVV
jgi:hypothetical protein